jgi:hypothetical protein
VFVAFLDLSDLDVLASAHFSTLEVAQQVLTTSAAHPGFVLRLSTPSKQPSVRFRCYQGIKSIKDQPINICPCDDLLRGQ